MKLYLKNITDEDHKGLITDMLVHHYQDIAGPDWVEKIPVKKLRERFSYATNEAKRDVYELFETNLFNTVAFAIMGEDDSLYGLALLDILSMRLEDESTDTYGQLYQLYIRPEYRKSFTSSDSKCLGAELKTALENYFKANDVNEVIMNIPKSVSYLLELGRILEFKCVKENLKTTETIHKF